jgi:hypothetical protein
MQYCEDIVPVAVTKLVPYVEGIELEIKLLKGWRKSNNKLNEKVGKVEL